MKKILTIFAHPDDESFAFGGTLAKYAKEGVEIHELCATRGEAGQTNGEHGVLAKIREQELLNASKVLGVKQVEFMDYMDGMLSNKLYHEAAEKIKHKIDAFQPQIVITLDRLGVSGHLDHIFISLVTTFVCQKYQKQLKLFYLVESKRWTDIVGQRYFIYFPPGYTDDQVDVSIDISQTWKTKVAAMKEHKTQAHDSRRILRVKQFLPRKEYFLAANPKKNPGSKTDLFGY